MKVGGRIRLLFLIAWILFLGACSIRLTTPERFPKAVRLQEVAPYDQEPRLCGPYALAAVFHYLGKEADPTGIAARIHSPGAGGTLTMDLYLEARRGGLAAHQENGTLETLRGEMEKGLPVIVLLRYSGLGRSAGHFVVVTGYSNDPAGFFILWGDNRLSWISDDRFEGLWSGAGFWMLFFSGEDQT